MMKRVFTLVAFVTLIAHQINAQYVDRTFFKAGFHASTTLGDATNFANLGMGVDFYQHWGVSKKFDLGIATGIQYFFGLDSTEDIGPNEITIRGEDIMYLPLAGFFRFYPIKSINFGLDTGYALGLNDSTEGGFYYRPTLSFDLSPTSALNFSYTGVQEKDVTWSAAMGGVIFRF